MKYGILITALISSFGISIWFFIALLRKKNLRAVEFIASAWSGNSGPGRVLALGFYIWTILFILALGMILFVAAMCAFYTIALIHGEVYLLLSDLKPTAGTIITHIIYPAEVFLFSVFMAILFIGSIQVFLGPVQPLSRLALKVEGIGHLCRKLIGILVVILMLELVKTAAYSLLMEPESLSYFFAEGVEPMMSPVPMAVLVAFSMCTTGLVTLVLKRRDK